MRQSTLAEWKQNMVYFPKVQITQKLKPFDSILERKIQASSYFKKLWCFLLNKAMWFDTAELFSFVLREKLGYKTDPQSILSWSMSLMWLLVRNHHNYVNLIVHFNKWGDIFGVVRNGHVLQMVYSMLKP